MPESSPVLVIHYNKFLLPKQSSDFSADTKKVYPNFFSRVNFSLSYT